MRAQLSVQVRPSLLFLDTPTRNHCLEESQCAGSIGPGSAPPVSLRSSIEDPQDQPQITVQITVEQATQSSAAGSSRTSSAYRGPCVGEELQDEVDQVDI